MRVLHVTPYFAPAFVYGGPPRSVLGLCRALRAAGTDVSIVTTTANGDEELPARMADDARYEDLPVAYLPLSFPKRVFRSAALRRVLSDRLRSGIDLVHIHGCWNAFGWTAGSVCRRAGVPYVVSPRGMLLPWSFAHGRVRKTVAYHLLERRALDGAVFVHATSADEADSLSALGVARPIVTVPNGIDDDTAAVRHRAADYRRRLDIPLDAPILLFLGRVHPKKGLELLIDAFRTASASHRAARLVVAGGGDPQYLERLQSLGQDLVGQRRLMFLGHVTGDDRALALASANAFALTSHSENFALGVAEAMAAGLPVIVTRACPWPMIAEWRAGWWVEPTAGAVTEAIAAWLDRPDAARDMGDRGRRAVLETFSWSQIGRRMVAEYESAITERPRPAGADICAAVNRS